MFGPCNGKVCSIMRFYREIDMGMRLVNTVGLHETESWAESRCVLLQGRSAEIKDQDLEGSNS